MFGKDYLGVDQTGADAAFAAGRAAIAPSGNWSVPTFLEAQQAAPETFKFDVMLPPLCPEAPTGTKSRAMVFPGNLWGVYSGSKHEEEAIKLVDYLSSDKNSQAWMDFYKTNLSLNRNTVSETTDPFQIKTKAWFDEGYTAPGWIMGIKLTTKFEEELTKVVRGEQTIDVGLQNVESYRESIKDELPDY
jgi:ABC-type glycerol-3-phosphate transport system substrate-binding protein